MSHSAAKTRIEELAFAPIGWMDLSAAASWGGMKKPMTANYRGG